MQNPKLTAVRRQGVVQRILGDDPAPPVVAPAADSADDGELARKSYCILRGRIEVLPSLRLTNRQGETRLFPWSGFAGANMDHPGELVLLFEGAASYTIRISGRGLDRELLAGIEAQRVAWIRELDDLVAAGVAKADPDEPVVTGIYITQESAPQVWSRGAGPSR